LTYGTGGTDTATVTITISGQNDAPDANDDTSAADEG
jgi:VCBS repeat-containing protein